ncbi:MAG: sulfotransferase family 2 domain-containing protein [Gomphosphaeria aponina SAG 52.96 = DSM 107014]|uniref:Sulfotransferase family 2 domain-containing protein n=1 Tax=Gomphosphaeria aponina SAG 52.96 = DSM 107014 TaxID=1521640 RepID=A0A941JST4_9CHRO|nr:sulfotransferase family 2 domain-containing protein [Gomphosphaeria aponina SAG 52.96 = DSM 107014]
MKRTILIHHHIYKNAGTSIQYALKKNFRENYYECDLGNHKVVTKDILENFILEHSQALAISGHHVCMPTPQGEEYKTISMILLRKPLARIESMYNYERQRKQVLTAGDRKAKELNIKEYVEWRLEKTPCLICNYQTYYCSREEGGKPSNVITEKDLERAIENIIASTVVGTVEKYGETLKLANIQLSRYYPGIELEYKKANRSKKEREKKDTQEEKIQEELGENIMKRLKEGNELDDKLYSVATAILNRRLRRLEKNKKNEMIKVDN